MQINQQLRGAILVFLGAISYGILATIVKYANLQGIHTSVLTFLQFAVGICFLIVFATVFKPQEGKSTTVDKSSMTKLLLFGTTFGMTSLFYYLSLSYIPVSMGIILLMQSIWMSVILESITKRKLPSLEKVIGAVIILFGTILATNALFEPAQLDWRGLGLGLLAATSYTISLYASSNVATSITSAKRSLFMILGGLIFITLYWNTSIIEHFNSSNALIWGSLLALFGTVIPPLLFTKGIPMVGLGIGAIIAAVEIPVSILSANIILGERMNLYQWLGVLIIFIAVVVVNRPKK